MTTTHSRILAAPVEELPRQEVLFLRLKVDSYALVIFRSSIRP